MIKVVVGVLMSFIALNGCNKEKDLPPGEKLALFKAVEKGDVDALKNALDAGISPNIQLPDSGYLISVATGFGNLQALEMLIQAGANVNATTESSNSPLITAMLGRSCEEARMLLQAGANPDEVLTARKAKQAALESELYDKTARDIYSLDKQRSFRSPINGWEKDKACWLEVERLMSQR